MGESSEDKGRINEDYVLVIYLTHEVQLPFESPEFELSALSGSLRQYCKFMKHLENSIDPGRYHVNSYTIVDDKQGDVMYAPC